MNADRSPQDVPAPAADSRIPGPGTPGWTLPPGEKWPSPVTWPELVIAAFVMLAGGYAAYWLGNLKEPDSDQSRFSTELVLIGVPLLAATIATMLVGWRRPRGWRIGMALSVAAGTVVVLFGVAVVVFMTTPWDDGRS